MDVAMGGKRRQRRCNTRQHIQDTALELFAEQGYDKTSLREIAERLGVTKAALYYHFKTKEEIIVSVFRDLTQPIEDLIEWGRRQPDALEAKQEIVRRYSRALADTELLHRFMQENQAAVRELRVGDIFKDQTRRLHEIFVSPGSDLVDQVRCISALVTLHAGTFVMQTRESDPDKRREAVLQVAVEMITQAYQDR
ncbi:TetR family transcriptional regulator [Streptomyces fodineus]|uniref:TetR family transcriptional regulator n=1 Tax=Streptomyces fodineus TaxID=1904616 RepID=A0A1D7YF44_9ACTN|nr:TetR/AcrR family transcriptional regulator [Streptomyces fodineus]AOR34248.1 TetR family transcriptional regulator [Streptomyces fodineus]